MPRSNQRGSVIAKLAEICGFAGSRTGLVGSDPRDAGEAGRFEPLEPRVLLSSGDLDPTFGVAGAAIGGGPGAVFTDFFGATRDAAQGVVAVQADGKIVAAGWSEGAGADFAITRFNADGSLDTGFGAGGKVAVDFDSGWDYASALALGPGGTIVVAGQSWDPTFTSSDIGVARLNGDGTLDATFGSAGKVRLDLGSALDFAQGVAVDASGRAVVVGSTEGPGADPDFAVVRLDTAGSLDATFGAGGVVTADFTIAGRSVQASDIAQDVAIDAGGSIIAGGGSFDWDTGTQYLALAKFDGSGALVGSFGSGGQVLTHVETYPGDFGLLVSGLAIDSTGRIVAAGAWSSVMMGLNVQGFGLARYTAAGALDTSFGSGGVVAVSPSEPGFSSAGAYDVAVDSSDRVVVAGSASDGLTEQFALSRYGTNGALDGTFGSGGRVLTDFGDGHSHAFGVAIDASGGIVAAGTTGGFGLQNDFALARYTAGGALDTSFDGDGLATAGFIGGSFEQGAVLAHAVAVQADGKILVAGNTFDNDVGARIGVARYLSNGELDSSFGSGGRVSYHFGVVPWFDLPTSIVVQADGKIVVAGQTSDAFGLRRGVIARLTSAGALDTSFGAGGWIVTGYAGVGAGEDLINDIAMDGSGRIVVAAQISDFDGDRSVIARYTSGGALDTSFDGDGLVLGSGDPYLDYLPQAVGIDSAGLIVVAGEQFGGVTQYDAAVRRYTASGAADTSFNGTGALVTDVGPAYGTNDFAVDMAIDGAGRIVIVGQALDLIGGSSTGFVARFTAGGAADTSFGSGGIARINPASATDFITGVVIDAAGRPVVTGVTSFFAGPGQDMFIARLSTGGALDGGFGNAGVVAQDFRGGADQPMGTALDAKGRIVVGGWTDDGMLQNPDFFVARFFPEDVHVTSVDVGRDLHSVIIQLDNGFLDPAQAANLVNYRLIASHGDSNQDSNDFNDGDETFLTLSGATFDASTNKITVTTGAVIFDDNFRFQIDGDDATSDGTPGLNLGGGDSSTDLNMRSLTLAGDLLDRIEALGISGGTSKSIVSRMENVVKMLGRDDPNEGGVIALLKSVIIGINQWYDRGGISALDRDALIADANLIILGLRLT